MMVSHRALVACVLLGIAPARAADPPKLAEVLESFGGFEADVATLRSGSVVTRELEPASETELGVSLAVLVNEPLATTLELVDSDAFFEQDREVLAHGEIDPTAAGSGLAGVSYTAGDADEIKRLLHAKAGSALNLSADEATMLRAVAGQLQASSPWTEPKAPAVVSEAYRRILGRRVEEFRRAGLDGIASYDRGKGKSMSPARALRAAHAASPIVRLRAPALDAALSGAASADVVERWLWLKQRAQDRPVFLLSHRMKVVAPGAVYAAERQYFVGQSWNCALVLGALVETDEGTLLLYANRIDVDAVGGAMGGMKRNIGRAMMEKSLRALLERVKQSAEATGH